MWQIIQKQQEQIDALQRALSLAQQSREEQASAIANVDEKVEMLAEETDGMQVATAPIRSTHVGGYGELHANRLQNQTAGGNNKNQIDFHRFVMFFDHQFNQDIKFYSELEVEHAVAGDGEEGAVELEQAAIEYRLSDTQTATAGLFLIPVGILNETHEPTTFYGTERNPIEKNIIPTTWWEAGAALGGEIAPGWSYDVALTSGLQTSSDSKYAVRQGRLKVANAAFDDLALTGRIKWTGMPGLELAVSMQYQGDITQSTDPDAGTASLIEAHAVWTRGPFGLRALAASWDLSGSGPAEIGADRQSGFYIEPSYMLNDSVGIFVRYNEWDNLAGNSADSEYQQFNLGINWWLHPDVVVKLDYQNQDVPAGKSEFDGVNLGLGYQF